MWRLRSSAGSRVASPYAAGVAGLILSVDPTLTPDQVKCIMATSAVDLGDPGYDTRFGWGFVNAENAVALAQCLLCTGDLNCDGAVSVPDLLALLAAWGPTGGVCQLADFDLDEIVGVPDLLTLLAAWGPCV